MYVLIKHCTRRLLNKIELEVILMNFTVLLSLLNIITADLIGWNRQYAVSVKSRQALSRVFESYTGAYIAQLLEHMLKNGNSRDAKRLMYTLYRYYLPNPTV